MNQDVVGVFHLHEYNRVLICGLFSTKLDYQFVPILSWNDEQIAGLRALVILEPELLITTIPLHDLIEQIDKIEIPVLIVAYSSVKLRSKRHNIFKSSSNPKIEELIEQLNDLLDSEEQINN